MEDPRRLGRIAGLLYLVVVVTGIFSLGYVPSRLAALVDPQGLPAAIRTTEPLFRAGIAAFALEQVAFLLLPMALYPLLRPAGRYLAATMVALAVVSVPLSMAALSSRYEALALATAPATAGGALDVQAGVERAMAGYRNGLLFAHLFWGAWLVPFGMLVLRSRALPAILGVLLVVGGAGYLIDVLGTVLAPDYAATAFSRHVLLPAAVAEIGSCLWLLAFGARRFAATAPALDGVQP